MRMAISLASEPVTAKFTTLSSPGACLAEALGELDRPRVRVPGRLVDERAGHLLMTSVSSGCEWPSTMHIMPELMS